MVGQQLQSILAAQSEFTGLLVLLPLKELCDFCLTDSSLLRAGAEPLARGFHCFLSILPDQTTVSLLCRTCVHTHTHICCVQTVYEIPLLPNNKTRMKNFSQIRAVRTVDWIFWLSLGRLPGGDWTNTWHRTERFTVLFCNRKQQHSYCHVMLFIALLEEANVRNITIVLGIHYTIQL